MRVRGFLVFFAALAVGAAATAYLLLNYDRLVQQVSSVGSPVAAPLVARDEDAVTLRDFQAFQQLTGDSLKAATQDIAAERTDLKTLSDQVSALAARIEAMQSTATLPPSQPAIPARPPPVGERKKPPVAKPVGRISVGGAPLPAPRPDGQ